MTTEYIRANAPMRNTNARWVFVFGLGLLFSYQTVVAASYKTRHIRQKNHWGPTTGRHMKEYGVWDYHVIEDEQEFHDEVRRMLMQAASDDLTKRMV
jgi:hypothetical protein